MRDAFIKLTLVRVFSKYIGSMDTSIPLTTPLSVSVECNIEGADYVISVRRKKQTKKQIEARNVAVAATPK